MIYKKCLYINYLNLNVPIEQAIIVVYTSKVNSISKFYDYIDNSTNLIDHAFKLK